MYGLIEKLATEKTLPREQMQQLLTKLCDKSKESKEAQVFLYAKAQNVSVQAFGHDVYIRGLIEISNYCKNNCYYCGIRKGNHHVHRYRLLTKEILACCEAGYEAGFRTFVLQGGEDMYYHDDIMCEIISLIKNKYPDCALTLSLGEKQKASYQRYFDAGADRYLLRHETINEIHYRKLHPTNMSLKRRVQCLYDLKQIGFQVGSGMMVGSPYQTMDMIIDDLYFLAQLKPAMIGIGPYLPHKDTPFYDQCKGSMELTLILISVLRLMHPNVLIPATTALSTIHEDGRKKGVLAGANVVMPNLSPFNLRKAYALYDNKKCTEEEAMEGLKKLKDQMRSINYEIVINKGDYKGE